MDEEENSSEKKKFSLEIKKEKPVEPEDTKSSAKIERNWGKLETMKSIIINQTIW